MSTARARRMCGPGRRPLNSTGSGQAVNGAPSRAHSKVAIGSLLSRAKAAIASPVSGSVVKLGLSGPQTIVVSGAVAVDDGPLVGRRLGLGDFDLLVDQHPHLEGVRAERDAVVGLRRQAEGEGAAVEGALVLDAAAGSGELERGGAALGGDVRAGVMKTGGAVTSTLQLHSAGVRSTLPCASLARTAKSCSPKIRFS